MFASQLKLILLEMGFSQESIDSNFFEISQTHGISFENLSLEEARPLLAEVVQNTMEGLLIPPTEFQ